MSKFLQSKTSRTMVEPVNFYLERCTRNSRILFGAVNSNFHFKDSRLTFYIDCTQNFTFAEMKAKAFGGPKSTYNPCRGDQNVTKPRFDMV